MALKSAIHDKVETWNKKDTLNIGDKITGYYVRNEIFKSRNFGDGQKFILADKEGNEICGLMGQAVIVRAFMNIPLYCRVEITYKGEVTSSNGQRVKDYEILFDDEDRINPSLLGVAKVE